MRISTLTAIPATLVAVLATTAGFAQTQSSSTTVSKPVTTLTKPAKVVSKSSTAQHGAPAQNAKQASSKDATPAAAQSAPITERSYEEGCHHGQDSDA